MVDILAGLNEPQRQAVTHVDGPLLVLAGAGSGKTRVITRRTAHLVARGVPPRNVLAITFTNKAAEEMRQRVEALDVPAGATICTFHSLCARLLREHADAAALSPNYSIYDRDDQLRLTREAMLEAGLAGANFTPSVVHGAISNAKNDLSTPQAYAEQAGDFFRRRVARVYEQYEKLLARNNALDFDDLLLRMAFLLRDRPEIREHLGRRYRYVLIDEYQDTNRAQYILAHGIALDHGNLCVTGDPDQSIYAWRGADISNILEFEHDYPEALVVRLEQNYRSTTPILAVASRLIDHNVSRRSKTLWTDRPGGEDVRVVLCDDEKAEARLIVEDVGQLLDEGEDLDGVAVFYRVNALSRVIEEALVKAGLPYRIARGTEFYGRKVIKDVLAYLRLLHNPADDLSCARIVNTPTRGIGEKTVAALRALAAGRGCSLSEAAAEAHQARLGKAAVGKVKAFAKMIAELRADAESGVAAVVENVVARSGLGSALDADDEDARQDRANVNELVSAAQQFDEDNGGTLADYLQQVSLVSDADHFEGSGRGAVTLMTLHAAKGLEFPRVYMVGCEEGLLPFVRQGDSPGGRASDRDLEEERRLAFVGITRTMDELTLSAARYRTLRGRRTPQTPSPFLREMGTENVEVDDRTTPVSERLMQRRRRRGAAGGFYDDADERAVIEAMQDAHDAQTSDSGRGLGGASAGADGDTADPPPPEYEHLRVGCRVHHPTFGWGQVLRVGSQAWPETRAEIHFDQVGIKKIVLGRGPSLELME